MSFIIDRPDPDQQFIDDRMTAMNYIAGIADSNRLVSENLIEPDDDAVTECKALGAKLA